jgi:selenocysteine-specific elongation factor
MEVPADDAVIANAEASSGATLVGGSECAIVYNAIAAAGIFGASEARIAAAAKLDGAHVARCIAELSAAGRVQELRRPPAAVAADVADDLLARAVERLRERHREHPWQMGLTSFALAHALGLPEAALVRVLTALVARGRLVYRGGYYCMPGFAPRLTSEQQRFFDLAFAADAGTPAGPLLLRELWTRIKSSAVPELRQAFETLVASGALAQVGEFVYAGARIAAIRAQLESELAHRGGMSVAQFRTLTGTSRKYAIPLLEFFDATGVTLREGDLRVLRSGPSPRDS